MFLIYLKYFYDAAQSKSISASARENHVSQSAVSQGIRKLEIHLKKDLLTHRRKAFKLTMEGEIVFASCKGIFKAIADLNESLETQEGLLSGSLQFGCSHSLSLTLLPYPLSVLTKNHPLVKPRFRMSNASITMDLVRRGVIEFGIVLENTDLSAFDKVLLDSGHFKLYHAKNFKVGKEVHNEFILSEEQKEIFLLKDAFKAKYKKDIVTLMEVTSWEVISNFIMQGVGIGFIPEFLVRNKERQKHFKEYDIGLPPFPYKVYAIYPKGELLSRNAEYFLSLFQGEHFACPII